MQQDLRACAGWIALLVAGQAALVQLIDAGRVVRYQHLRPPAAFLDAPVPVLVVLVLQVLLVGWGLSRRRQEIAQTIGRAFRPWQVLALGTLLFVLSATPNRDIPAFLLELPTATLFQFVALGNVVLAVSAIPPAALSRLGGAFDRLLGAPADPTIASPGGVDRFAIACAAAVVVITALLNVFVYQRHPHLLDEVVYLIQARQLGIGHVATPPPPVPEAFVFSRTDICPAGWYMVTQPGWAALLATGELVGLGWLVNPLLSGLCVLAAYVLLRHLYDLRTARLATLLLAFSPWFLFLGMSYMNHQATLLFAIYAALGVVWARSTGRMAWAWLGGAALGVVSLMRQLDAIALALPLGLWALGFGGKRIRLWGVTGLVLGSIIASSPVLPYNKILTGSFKVFPMMAYTDRVFGPGSNGYGFGPTRGMGWPSDPFPGHGNKDAIVNADLNATAINVELFGWSIGSLLPLAALLVLGSLVRSDRNMLGLSAGVFVAYWFNYFSGGPDFGGRYWYLMIVPFVALTARSVEALAKRLARSPEEVDATRARLIAGGAMLCLGAVVAFMPWRAVNKYYHYRGMQPGVERLAREHGFGRSLVLVRGPEFPDFISVAISNPLDFQADGPLYARDRGVDVREALLRAYPDRPIWVVDGPSRSGGTYRVVAGPVSPSDAATLPPPDSP